AAWTTRLARAHHRHAARPLHRGGDPMVRGRLRPGLAYHRTSDPDAESATGAGHAAAARTLPRRQGRSVARRRTGEDPARDPDRRARQRFHHAAYTVLRLDRFNAVVLDAFRHVLQMDE